MKTVLVICLSIVAVKLVAAQEMHTTSAIADESTATSGASVEDGTSDRLLSSKKNKNKKHKNKKNKNGPYYEWPTSKPTNKPTEWPTEWPTEKPTNKPTKKPTKKPTSKPTEWPTKSPTEWPTKSPTEWPTNSPTPKPTKKPKSVPQPQWPNPWSAPKKDVKQLIKAIITPESNDKLCMTLEDPVSHLGKPELEYCSYLLNDKSQWFYYYHKDHTLRPYLDEGLCVSVDGIESGKRLQMKRCLGKSGQYWHLIDDEILSPKGRRDLCVVPVHEREGSLMKLKYCDVSYPEDEFKWSFVFDH